MSHGCVPTPRTQWTCSIEGSTNTTTTFDSTWKICLRSGTGDGQLISVRQAPLRRWPRGILAEACSQIAKWQMLDESGGVKITLRVIWHNTPHRLPQRLYLWYSHDS